jgi:hypothetical protein
MNSEINSRYVARCHKALKELGVPLENWFCFDLVEMGVSQ